MKSKKEKFYVVAERYSSQFGTHLSDVHVGVRRDNKLSITCTFEYLGEKWSLRFSDHAPHEHKIYPCINAGDCLHGSMHYYGFGAAEDARDYLEKIWPKHYNLAKCLAKLRA